MQAYAYIITAAMTCIVRTIYDYDRTTQRMPLSHGQLAMVHVVRILYNVDVMH